MYFGSKVEEETSFRLMDLYLEHGGDFIEFRQDLDVISASSNSKATLRAAADEFVVGHDNVFYFPAFEMATIYQPITGSTWLTDGKENFHINKKTVRFIMRQFFRIFAPTETLDG